MDSAQNVHGGKQDEHTTLGLKGLILSGKKSKCISKEMGCEDV
jgi:hypothetical protein